MAEPKIQLNEILTQQVTNQIVKDQAAEMLVDEIDVFLRPIVNKAFSTEVLAALQDALKVAFIENAPGNYKKSY